MWGRIPLILIGNGKTGSMNSFDYIYNSDGTCHFWYCGRRGVILAYDDMSPEGAL
jgi:hypothetical protein